MQNFETQEQLLQKRLAQAQAMRDQEFTPAEGQMISGHYVRPDFSQSLVQGLRMYRGIKEAQGAETELKDLQAQKQQAMQGDMNAMITALRGKPAETVQPLTPNDDEGNVNAPVQMPAQEGGINQFYEAALKSQFPQFQKMGMEGMMQMPQIEAQQQEREAARTFRQQEAQAARDARAEELQMRMQDQRTSQQEKLAAQRELQQMQIEARKDMQRMIASTRQAPQAQIIQTDAGPMQLVGGKAMPIVGPDGKPVSAPKKGAAGLSSTAQKELFEADDAVQNGTGAIRSLQKALELNKDAYSGVGASTRATIASNLPGQYKGADATIAMENIIKDQALTSMKSIFGGNPTEGERAILLDLQASASKTPKQREEILGRAMQAAQRRLDFNKQKADNLRGGSYMSEGGAPKAPPAQTNSIDALLEKYK
jgi:hypothetical protein